MDFKTVNTVLSHTFNHKICFKYAVYIVGCVCGLFLTVKFSCLFTAVPVLACLRSLMLLKVPNRDAETDVFGSAKNLGLGAEPAPLNSQNLP